MEIDLGEIPFGFDFHPSKHLVAAGLITGDFHLYRYIADSPPERLLDIHAHSDSCRAVRFTNFGQVILTASSDRSIMARDTETGTQITCLENAHEHPIFSLINLTESTVATGDDNGCIKIWDTRQRSCCSSYNAHEDYVSDMTYAADSMKLLATSGDGTLSVFNLHSNKFQTRSEFSEEELLSVVIMKNGRKVICGTQDGTLMLYSWGFFKDCSDRFVGLSPNSVDSLLKLDEDRVIVGCENGLISLVNILPNGIIQPLAEHAKDPIECLGFSCDKKYLGSISHDNMLKFWDLDDLLPRFAATQTEQIIGSDSDDLMMDVDTNPQKSKKGTERTNRYANNSTSNFFADM